MEKNDSLYPSLYHPFLILPTRPTPEEMAMTGARLTGTLAYELRHRNLRHGIASACIGGGMGIALLIENVN